jgi:hypothetical protein
VDIWREKRLVFLQRFKFQEVLSFLYAWSVNQVTMIYVVSESLLGTVLMCTV